MQVLNAREVLTPADHQTHRRFVFEVPPQCREIRLHLSYTPKHLSAAESMPLAAAAVVRQTAELAARVGEPLAERWAAGLGRPNAGDRLANLLTVSLDDARGTYRGAGHRHAHDQRLVLGPAGASPGLVAAPLPPGAWTLTISIHTLVSAQCELSIQIDAETASSP